MNDRDVHAFERALAERREVRVIVNGTIFYGTPIELTERAVTVLPRGAKRRGVAHDPRDRLWWARTAVDHISVAGAA